MPNASEATTRFLKDAEQHLVAVGFREPREHRRRSAPPSAARSARPATRVPLDRSAFWLALLLTPVVIGTLGVWTLILPVAMVVGLPAHLLIGGPVGWLTLRATSDHGNLVRILACALAGFAVAPLVGLIGALGMLVELDVDSALLFGGLVMRAASVFGPLNGAIFAIVYVVNARQDRGRHTITATA